MINLGKWGATFERQNITTFGAVSEAYTGFNNFLV
jgi:hypothetical protein